MQQSGYHRFCGKFDAEHESEVSENENQAVGELQAKKVLEKPGKSEKSEITCFC